MTLNKEKSIGDVESPGSLNLSDDFVDVSPVPSVMSMASDCSSSYSLSSNDTAEDVADVLIEASLVENEQAADEAQDAGRRVGAGIAVGVVTMPFFGLVVAAMAGVAASYGATQPGATGDVCRACGDVALNARDKAVEVNEKHDLSNKAKAGASKALQSAKETNEKYGILERVQNGIKVAWKKLNEFEKEHHVVERTINSVSNIFKNAAERMKKARQNNQEAENEKEVKANLVAA